MAKRKKASKQPKRDPIWMPRRIAKPGRPLRLTRGVMAEIFAEVERGGSVEDVCTMMGIGQSTLYRWQQQGREEKKGVFREFWEGLQDARAARRVQWERRLDKAGNADWRALKALMEMTEPKHYAPRVRVHVQEELTDALRKLKERFAPDLYEQILSAIAEDAGGDGAGEAEGGTDGGDDQPSGEAVHAARPQQ